MAEEKLEKEFLFLVTKARKVHQMMHERVNESARKAMKDFELDERTRWLEWRRQGLDKVPISA